MAINDDLEFLNSIGRVVTYSKNGLHYCTIGGNTFLFESRYSIEAAISDCAKAWRNRLGK